MSQVVLYTKNNCAYCVMAKQLLSSKNIPFEEIRVDQDPEKLSEMMARSQKRTVPQVFINDEPIGGYDDLTKLMRSGDLDRLIQTK